MLSLEDNFHHHHHYHRHQDHHQHCDNHDHHQHHHHDHLIGRVRVSQSKQLISALYARITTKPCQQSPTLRLLICWSVMMMIMISDDYDHGHWSVMMI